MPTPNVTTEKMKNETPQQYMAWLLYCEAGSIPKMMQAWEQLRQGIGETSGIFGEKVRKLGALPCERNVEAWCSKYRWVDRREIKLAEDLEALRDKTKKIKREKLHKIAEAFERTTNKIIKRLRADEEPSMLEWKLVWEMFQVELGKPTNRSQLEVDEQHPLTSKEKEYGKKLHEAVKEIVRKQHRGK